VVILNEGLERIFGRKVKPSSEDEYQPFPPLGGGIRVVILNNGLERIFGIKVKPTPRERRRLGAFGEKHARFPRRGKRTPTLLPHSPHLSAGKYI
jgi:hypothetical protein